MVRFRPARGCGAGAARARGFSLVEMMVTVAVIAIVGAIAAPAFSDMIRHNRVVSSSNEMVAALQLARAEALARRSTTALCASNDGRTCSGSVGSLWIVLSTKNGVPSVLRSITVHPGLRLVPSGNLASTARIGFSSSGFVQVGATTSGTISLCAADLSGNNAVDVSAAVVRIGSSRRAAGAGCSAPGDI